MDLRYLVLQSLFVDIFESEKIITLQIWNFKFRKNNFSSKLINMKCIRFIVVEITKSVDFKFNI